MANVIRSRFVMANGIRTHYSESGNNGPTIVSLHGGGAGSSGEAGMGPILKRLDEQYRYIALDSVGGFGQTDVAAKAGYGIGSRVAHLESVADALCLDRFTLMGNSQGAWAAARYATLHPDRVERLILVSSATLAQSFGLDVPVNEEMKKLLGFDGTRESMRAAVSSLFHDKSLATDSLVDLRFASAMRPGASAAFKLAQGGTARLQTDPIFASYFDLSKALPAFTKVVPTIVIWGETDEFATPDLGRAIAKRMPEARFHWLDNAGHQVQADQPEQTVSIIEAFMKTPAGEW